ncbi:MAG: flagellar hook capping protein [Campylobacteraceae bacterium]|nr:flagellar hook capping protein [Campylobacteraceae bacterium]
MTTNQLTRNESPMASAASAVNPGAILDKDAFMKLLLVELQYQDPTDPMDSEKMLTQTSQLATLETQENTNKMMEKLANKMGNSMNMYAISAIGKMASIGYNAVSMEEGRGAKFEVYFQKEIHSGKLKIEDKEGKLVRTVDLEEGGKGVLAFEWDGLDDNGSRLPSGFYSVKAEYLDSEQNQQTTQFGTYPVESVRIDDGEALIKLGSSYVPLDYIKEFY